MYLKIFTALFLLSAGLFGFSSYALYTILRIDTKCKNDNCEK